MRYVALLRAVNVGGRWIKMAELAKACKKAGLRDVETFIGSGNVLFDSDDDPAELEPYLERVLEKSFGIRIETFVRNQKQLAAAARCAPFPEVRALAEIPRAHGLWIGFMRAPAPAANRAAVTALGNEHNDLRIRGREIYWYSTLRPTMLKITGRTLERALGASTTFRGIPSVKKMAELLRD